MNAKRLRSFVIDLLVDLIAGIFYALGIYTFAKPANFAPGGLSGLALIATVGRGMVRSKGISARLFNALMKAGSNVRLIDQGSSELNIIVGVDNLDFENAVRAIYRAFVIKENNRW